METLDFTYTDNRVAYPELCFDTQVHVISIPTLDISLPSVLKTAEDSFLQALSVGDRKAFRKFCRDCSSHLPSLTGRNLLLPLQNMGRYTAALVAPRDDGNISVRFIKDTWDIYDPSMPVFHTLHATVQKFCAELHNLDGCIADGSVFSGNIKNNFSMLSDMVPGYIDETLDNLHGRDNMLCDLREISDWLLKQLQSNPLFHDMEISLFDPLAHSADKLVVPLHLSAWIYVFLLMTHMMSSLSTDRQLKISLLQYEDRVDCRWETASNLSSAHFRSNKSLTALIDAVPSLRIPAEFVKVLGCRHGFNEEVQLLRSRLSCTMTVHHFTEHLLDFKFNNPIARAHRYYSEASALYADLQSMYTEQ